MDGTDIVQFHDRRAEEEKIARAATPGLWWYNRGKQWLNGEAFVRYDVSNTNRERSMGENLGLTCPTDVSAWGG
ncbi:hypothetical protein ACFVU3_28620 [Streptomyces sp. NPDC058052]|uniref:hypothetical protein n=1 Tax=Streptomyces sp. NPDC058052 TaxID=3346316 RepID=UPI0036E91F1F